MNRGQCWKSLSLMVVTVVCGAALAYTPLPDDPCPVPFDPQFPIPYCPQPPVGGDETPISALEMLGLIGQEVDNVEVINLNACGEVDPYYVGEACEYTLKFPDGRLVYAWLVGSWSVIYPGLYRIKYLDGQPGAAYARWNVFMALERKVEAEPFHWPYTQD